MITNTLLRFRFSVIRFQQTICNHWSNLYQNPTSHCTKTKYHCHSNIVCSRKHVSLFFCWLYRYTVIIVSCPYLYKFVVTIYQPPTVPMPLSICRSLRAKLITAQLRDDGISRLSIYSCRLFLSLFVSSIWLGSEKQLFANDQMKSHQI